MSLYTTAPGDTYYDYYLVGYDNTGVEVIHEYLFSSGNCAGISNQGTPWGGGGGTPTTGGGGSGGGGGMLTPNTVLVVSPDKPIIDILDYIKCFNLNQSATFTVYARQPVPGHTDTWKWPLGAARPDVGHTFISITQNGITRVFGFYPSSFAAPGVDSPGAFGNNSGDNYTVSITTIIAPNNVLNLIQYIISHTSSTYSLDNYNCTDFGIGAAAATGLQLPDTYGTWGGLSGGSNPANLGQDMRNMVLPSGASRGSARTAPPNQGGC